MTTSATRRFVDLIGEQRLERGAWKIDKPRPGTGPMFEAFCVGKEFVIMTELFSDEVVLCPYLQDSNLYHAFRSGVGIECADLQDVVRRWS